MPAKVKDMGQLLVAWWWLGSAPGLCQEKEKSSPKNLESEHVRDSLSAVPWIR